MQTVVGLQKKLAKALEMKQDPVPILRELAELRAKQAADKDLAEAQKIADLTQQEKDRAAGIQEKVNLQSNGIDQFLALRDTLVSQFCPLLEPMSELAKMAAPAWEQEPGICYSGFNDMSQFAAAVREIPQGYLPVDFGCPFLEMIGGQVSAYGKATEAYNYFMAALGILSNFTKEISTFPLQPAPELIALDNEAATEAGSCIVCSHAEIETINNLLRQGKPLRDIESEFEISRSTLSRHKQHIAATVSQEG